MLTSLVCNPACIFRTNANALSTLSHCARISAAPAIFLRTGDRARGELKGGLAFGVRTGDRARGELRYERREEELTAEPAGDRAARGEPRPSFLDPDRPQISRARKGPCNFRCNILAVVGDVRLLLPLTSSEACISNLGLSRSCELERESRSRARELERERIGLPICSLLIMCGCATTSSPSSS